MCLGAEMHADTFYTKTDIRTPTKLTHTHTHVLYTRAHIYTHTHRQLRSEKGLFDMVCIIESKNVFLQQ